MTNDKEYRKKRTLGIVIMLTIIEFSLILMITTFTEDLFFGTTSRYGEGNNEEDTDPSALLTLQYGSDIDFKVPMSLMQIESFNYDNFDAWTNVEVEKQEDKIIISDATKSQTVINLNTEKNKGIECYYDLVFEVESNTFETIYHNNTKMNELSISLIGKDKNNNTFESNEILLLDDIKDKVTIKSNVKMEATKDIPGMQTWDLQMHFINYRYIDQNVNTGKELHGKFKVENFQCLVKK